MACHLIWKIDFNMLSASSPKIIQVLKCLEHNHARHFWLTVEILISLVNIKFHQEQLVRSDHKGCVIIMRHIFSFTYYYYYYYCCCCCCFAIVVVAVIVVIIIIIIILLLLLLLLSLLLYCNHYSLLLLSSLSLLVSINIGDPIGIWSCGLSLAQQR